MISVAHSTPHVAINGLGSAVLALCAKLAHRGLSVRVHTLEPVSEKAPTGVELVAHPRGAALKSLGVSSALKRALHAEATRKADVMHAHSLWTMASMYPGWAVRGTKCRYVHSPHGTLAAWALNKSKWRKKAVWALMQRGAISRADCFLVTSGKERDEVRAAGFKNAVGLVPIGIDVPAIGLFAKNAGALKRLLFLGRLHPVKALDRLLESWRLLQARFGDWELVIAGSDDDGYRRVLEAQAKELKLVRVSFTGDVVPSERDALYQSADLFVLPSHTENFGIVVVESLANGVPAVVSRFAPWKELEREGCGWWTDTQPEILAESLGAAMALPAEARSAMGARGREWMTRAFSWERVGEMTEQTYAWLLGGGSAPGWVDK